MATPVQMPQQGNTVTECLLVEWCVEEGGSVGSGDIVSNGKEWPIYTADGSLSVHYEADILVTDNGARDLTEGMDRLPDIVR